MSSNFTKIFHYIYSNTLQDFRACRDKFLSVILIVSDNKRHKYTYIQMEAFSNICVENTFSSWEQQHTPGIPALWEPEAEGEEV